MNIKIIENGKIARIVFVQNFLELFVLDSKNEKWEF